MWHLHVDAQHQRRIALLRLSEQVQLKVANAHLWLEEALAEDEHVDLARDVYGPIEDATRLLELALKGGQTPVGLLAPATSEDVVQDLRALGDKMAEFKRITETRWRKRHGEGLTGGAMDQRYDEVYKSILHLPMSVAAGANDTPRGGSRGFVRTILVVNLFALGLCVAMLVLVVRAWAVGRVNG